MIPKGNALKKLLQSLGHKCDDEDWDAEEDSERWLRDQESIENGGTR